MKADGETLRCAGSALAAFAFACAFAPPPADAQPATRYVRIGETAGFPRLHQALQRIVDEGGRQRRNSFCLMLADSGDGDPLAYAIWRERGLLYRWGRTLGPQIDDEALILHQPLDLRRDIVRTEADRASTYLVTRRWVRDVEFQCREHGEVVSIMRRKR